MQYVHRPTQPCSIGMIASCHPNDWDSMSADLSPHAVPASRGATIWGHLRGGRSLAVGTAYRTHCRYAAAMQPAMMRGQSYAADAVTRQNALRCVVYTTV